MKYDLIADLPVFLAYSLELEREAAERLREFAAMMSAHNQHELARTFNELATFSEQHATEVAAICQDREIPGIPAWEFEWPEEEPPETYSYHKVGYHMTTKEALEAMLAQERASAEFYAEVANRTPNKDIRDYATSFAEEERDHAHALEQWLDKLPANSGNVPDIDPPKQID